MYNPIAIEAMRQEHERRLVELRRAPRTEPTTRRRHRGWLRRAR